MPTCSPCPSPQCSDEAMEPPCPRATSQDPGHRAAWPALHAHPPPALQPELNSQFPEQAKASPMPTDSPALCWGGASVSHRTRGAHTAVGGGRGVVWNQCRLCSTLLNSGKAKGHSSQRCLGPYLCAQLPQPPSLQYRPQPHMTGSHCCHTTPRGSDHGAADH